MAKRKLTLKQQGFVKDVVKTKNASKAVRNNYDTTDQSTVGTIAYENMHKPAIVEEIHKALDKAGLNDTFVTQEHHKVIAQDKQLSSKVQAINSYYTLKGYNKDTDTGKQLNVAFIINNGNVTDASNDSVT